MDKLSPPVRQLLAISLIVFPVLFVVSFVALPLVEAYSSYNDEIKTKRELLGRYQNSIQNAAKQKAQQAQNGQSKIQHFFLTDENETLAQTKLQANIKKIITINRAAVRVARGLETLEDKALRLIGVSVDFGGSHQSVRNIVHAIETASPFLFIEKAEIKVRTSAGRFNIYQPSQLQVQLDIYAALKPKTPSTE
ncbi:MAG: type II secretion system protein GspM [Pseudomonadota bacterium]